MIMKKTISILGLPLLAITTMPLAHAEVQGVAPLLKQARYWQSKGRGDLARQAYNRVLAIDLAAIVDLAPRDLELATTRWSHLSKLLA